MVKKFLLNCLERSEKNGIMYHRDEINGDYDDFDDVETLIEYIKPDTDPYPNIKRKQDRGIKRRKTEMLTIRNEEPRDYEIVERMTRNSFYNLYIPGCMEHYLVHIMREHKDFIPELDFVLELDNKAWDISCTRGRH